MNTRPLRFRQYHDGKWHYWGYLEEDGRVYFQLPLDIRPIVPSYQDTGLKDKNGKEIYEGDVLAHKSRQLKKGVKLLHEVKWDKLLCKFEMPHPLFEFEIIGNIVENPGLIDKK